MLTATTAVPIGTVATGLTGQTPTITTQAQGGRPSLAPPAETLPEPAGLTVAGEVEHFTPVTDELLRNPDPGDWLMVRRNYEAWSHSPLTEITRDNVAELELAWIWAMREGGWNAPSPVAHDGVLYLAGFGHVVQALDARTGDLIWEHQVGAEARGLSGTSRILAIYQDKLFLATSDARLIALDARTGAELWTTRFAENAQGFRARAVRSSSTARWCKGSAAAIATPVRLLHQRLRRRDGQQLWRFNTVARSDEPGGNTWANLPNSCEGAAIPGSPGATIRLDLIYFGVAQAKPWVAASRGMTVRDAALYTSSTVALRPDDGTLAWHFQHVPGETLDLDEVYERVLVDLRDRQVVFSAGKHGILWKLDRTTGEFLGYKETVFQNVFDRIDPETGASPTARTSSMRNSSSWSRRVPARRAARTGTR